MGTKSETPVCLRCCEPVKERSQYCARCGAPVGTYTTCLPFEYIPAYADLLVRCGKQSLKGNGLSWPMRLLGLLTVLIHAPVVFLLLPFGEDD